MIQFDEHIFQMGWFNHQLEFYSKKFQAKPWWLTWASWCQTGSQAFNQLDEADQEVMAAEREVCWSRGVGVL